MLRSRLLSRVGGQVGPAACSTDGCACAAGSVGAGECPAEAGELARDGDRDDRAALAAFGVEAPPDAV
jgi:hypothetical protein